MKNTLSYDHGGSVIDLFIYNLLIYYAGRLSKAMHKMESSLKEPTDLVKQYNDMDPDMVTTHLLHSQLQSHGKSKDEVHETFAFKLKEENVKDNLLNSKANIAIYKDLSQAFNSSSVDERGQVRTYYM